MSERDNKSEKLSRFLTATSSVSDATLKTGLSFIVGPVGAIAGAAGITAAKAAIQAVGSDFVERQLSALQQRRVRELLLMAAEKIDQKLAQGLEVRSDRFFVREFGHRSMSDELLEGVLLAAQLEYEERKLPYLANLYAFLVFEPDIGRMQGNMLVRHAQDLSYTQYRLLAIFGQPERTKHLHDRFEDEQLDASRYMVLQEALELANRNLVLRRWGDDPPVIPSDVGQIVPSSMHVMAVGELLFQAMELWRIPDDDLQEVIAVLI